ncbi:DUF4236 domain-containing protein [Sinorhizobium meliloti]|nr:DUF4236 domain-containing protein [Sinorhizobium meliloti]
MGFSFRKSFKVGPFRTTLSHRGITNSIGAGGLRYSKRARFSDTGGRRSRSRAGNESNDNRAAGAQGNPIVGFVILGAIAYAIYSFLT